MEASQQVKRTAVKKGVCPAQPKTVKDGVASAVVPKGTWACSAESTS